MIRTHKEALLKKMRDNGGQFRSEPEEGFYSSVKFKTRSQEEQDAINMRASRVYQTSGSDYDPYE